MTTRAHLNRLNQQGIRFITLRRRSRKMLARIWSRPPSAWRRITLPALTRTFRTSKVLDERIHLKDYDGLLRQLTVIELGHEDPTVQVDERRVTVRFDKRAHNPYLVGSGLADHPTPMPWFGGKSLLLHFD